MIWKMWTGIKFQVYNTPMTDSDTQTDTDTNTDTTTQPDDGTPKLFRSVVVQPKMLAIGEWKNVRKRVGTKKVKQVTGILKKEEVEVEQPVFEIEREWVNTGRVSDVQIDVDQFATDITDACNALDAEGYEVVNITPVVRGQYQHQHKEGNLKKGTGFTSYGLGFGYSVTDGVIILGKRR